MNLIWSNSRFEAQFQPGDTWKDEQEKTRAAGFKCTGPPDWIWYAAKAQPLTKLRQNRPAVLTIAPEALEQFQKMSAQEEAAAVVKAQLKEAKKKLKKEQHEEEVEQGFYTPEYWEGKESIGREDLPPEILEQFSSRDPIPVGTDKRCRYCQEPVYFYEKEDVCIWCEKEFEDILFGDPEAGIKTEEK